MSTPVETTIRTHLRANDAVQETIEWAEIVSRLDSDTPPVTTPRRSRRFGVWVAVVAVVVTILLVGLIPLLVRNEETPPANTIVSTTLSESLPPVTGGVIGPGSWTVAATFPDGSLSPAQAAEAVTQVEAWPGVLGVVAVQDESAWRQLTGLVSDCGDGKVLPPCGSGVVVLATTQWMARVAERLESEFGMEAITALDVPAEFWDGYVERVSSSQVALVFDPGALGTEQPLNGPIFEISGEVCDSDDCDLVVENEVDGFGVVAGVGFDSDGVGIVLGGIGGTGFSINDLLVDGFGNGGAIAILDAWTDDESPIGVRRIYAVAGLPIDAAVVTMELADGTRVWQRPVGGMVFFVDNLGSMPERFVEFYDQDGIDRDELEELGPVRPLVVLDRNGAEIMRIEDVGDGRTLVTDLRFDPDAISKSIEAPFLVPDAASSLAGKIAYTSNERIMILDLDSDFTSQLTDGPGEDFSPSLSPDGTRIAFVSDRDGNNEIYVMDADGANVTRLTDSVGFDENPAWSPDGSRIAYDSGRDGQNNVYVMDADGSNVTNLTNYPEGPSSDPSWSPDGTRIVFASARDGGSFGLYVMNADGTNVTRLPGFDDTAFSPAWSPDGTRIAFGTWVNFNTPAIYVVNADGSNVTPLAFDIWALAPAWSPDSARIVYQGASIDNGQQPLNIYVMDADGSNVIQLSNGPGDTGPPTWAK